MTMNESAENYLETILVLSHSLPVVRSVDIANDRRYLSNVRNVAIPWRHYIPFNYLGGYVHITYPIVCGNCEAYYNLLLFYK